MAKITENKADTRETGQEMAEADVAVAGREYWLFLKEKYQLNEETGLIIMQSKKPDMIDMAIRLIPAYRKRKYLKKVLVVMDQETAAQITPEESSEENLEETTFVTVQREQLEQLLAYYRLVQFFHEIVVVSVEEPYGNAHIIGKAGISLEDYVKNALYV